MRVSLVFAPGPREVVEIELELPSGSTASQALAASGWSTRFPLLQKQQSLFLSIWGRNTTDDAVLREGDRLEVCRGLRVDPKVARRERFAGQGARGTGLFSQRRPGSKAGY